MLEAYKDFDPSLVALISKAEPETFNASELLDLDVLPAWVLERLALLGDAAHPFFPGK
jgi:2-polyprenyl-6-methoxyphenol hydroxylase-like FAD-dependent oxidoreductase